MADIDGVAGIDAHTHTFTVAVLDGRGGRCGIGSFPTSLDGLTEVLALLDSFGFAIGRIGVEGSAGLGRHVAAFLVAAGYDVREVQANRTAERRRRRRRHKTDREDAEAIARRRWLTPACRQPASSAGPIRAGMSWSPCVTAAKA